MLTAIDTIKKITLRNDFPFLNFDKYRPRGWKAGTTEHFKEEMAKGKRRSPVSALEHSPPDGLFLLSREEILVGFALYDRINKITAGDALQVLSPVFQNTGIAHIPMLDVEIPPSDENLEYLISCIRALGETSGAILLSGASYHYYGYNLQSSGEWQKFMYRSLLLDSVVDARWVGHRLIDEHARLRITKKEPHDFIPYVVTEL